MPKFLCFILLVGLVSSASLAQQVLSARDAVFLALENNYQVQIAQQQEKIAQKNNTWSEAGLFPTVSLNASFGNTIQDNTKNPFTFTPGIILSQSFSPALSANWNIFSGFSVRISKERLALLEDQSAGNSLLILENTSQDVLKAYYTAVLQKKRIEIFKHLLTYARKNLNYYEVKEKYSTSSSLDLLQFKNQYLSDSTNLLLQEISYHNALRNLNLLLNLPEDQLTRTDNFTLSDSLQIHLDLVDFDLVKAEMLASNQNLKNQYISVELQQKAVELQKAFLYPTLSFQTGVTPSNMWLRDLKDSGLKINTQALSYYGNINLRYTIFNNWKTKRAVEVSRIQTEIAELSTKSMENSLLVNLSSLVELLKSRNSLLNLSEENAIYATKIFEMSQRRFELGTINSLQLFTAQNAYYNTMIQHYENQFNRLDTYLEIYKLSGKLGLVYGQ